MKEVNFFKKTSKIYNFFHGSLIALVVFNMSSLGVFFISPNTVQAIPLENLCQADVDVVMVMDRSGSMLRDPENPPTRIVAAKAAANDFLLLLGTNDQSSLVSFADDASLDKGLSNNHSLDNASTKTAINALSPIGNTNIGDAIMTATDELLSSRANDDAVKVMILLTDGMANRPLPANDANDQIAFAEAHAEAKAAEAAAAGIKVFTIGLGTEINEASLIAIANITGGAYYAAPGTVDLAGIYGQISLSLCDFSSISGCKYIDADKDGNVTDDDLFLDGWEILLGGDKTDSVKTDSEGCYTFTGLVPGNYTVTEGVGTGIVDFEQTMPMDPDFYTFDIGWEENLVEKHFGNYFPVCGNSILDSEYGEVCEIGETDICDAAGYPGTKACDSTCSWGDCVPDETCGDGVINGDEQCDGDVMGDYNSAHYICESCTAVYQSYCGDDITDQPNSSGFMEFCDGDNDRSCTTLAGYDGYEECNACTWDPCETDDECGDGDLNGTEACDDGNNNGKYGYCNDDCTGDTPSICGNSVQEGTEACDDGPSGSATCAIDCTIISPTPICGDYNLDIGEDCDDGPLGSATCAIDCTVIPPMPSCGDGNLDADEECDDNNTVDGDGCSSNCEIENVIRGCKYNDENNNGVIDDGEETLSGWEIKLQSCPYPFFQLIDDGFDAPITGACVDYSVTTTGDDGCYAFFDVAEGEYNLMETEQLGWTQTYPINPTEYSLLVGESSLDDSYDFANYKRKVCGDGIVQAPNDDEFNEECDGSADSGYYCTENCTLEEDDEPYCGDGEVNQEWEECDGSADSGYYCTEECMLEEDDEPYCGDGEVNQEWEECDGSANCTSDCTIIEEGSYCGDGTCDEGETNSNCCKDCGSCGGGRTTFNIKNTQLLFRCTDDGKVSVDVSWLSSKDATSRVVYDTVSHDGSDFGTAPNYGYASSTIVDETKETGHSVLITGLETETVYYFRGLSIYNNKEANGAEKFFTETLSCTGNDNNTEIIVLGETAEPVLEITKTSSRSMVNRGEEFDFEIVVTNTGNLAAADVVLKDILPEGLKFVSTDDMTMTWNLGDIEIGDSNTTVVDVKAVSDAEYKVYVNTASVSATNHEEVTDTATVEVGQIKVLAATGMDSKEMMALVLSLISVIMGSTVLRRKIA